MQRQFRTSLFALMLATSGTLAFAQPGFGPPEGQRGPGGNMLRMLPVMAALDADDNGEISADEIEKSTAALKGLDKNGDGKLTMDELRPEVGGRGGPGRLAAPAAEGRPDRAEGERGGGDRPGEGQHGEGRRGEGRRGDREAMFARLMAMDKNGDGKLGVDEVEGRMSGLVERADTDQDGFATLDEIRKLADVALERFADGRGPFEGGNGPGGNRNGGPGLGGFRNPQQFVDRAFEFDADNDGKLSREELLKMLNEAGPPPGARSEGRPGGDRGDRRPGERGEGRRPGQLGDPQ